MCLISYVFLRVPSLFSITDATKKKLSECFFINRSSSISLIPNTLAKTSRLPIGL
ncbi:hypothetical protein NTHI1209_00544 [Haemophilus influenzae]|uniref:Uncharacterized protein n=1 Tax=Haemophilus influenzae TaxID=727 RepID=A0A158SVP7_HAEIF|nr:hypothetical protein NTHI1209_00544 [Haemophilus influenzae]